MKNQTNHPYEQILAHIRSMLSCLSVYVKQSIDQNCGNINVACENLVLILINEAYDLKLENYNSKLQVCNAPGIDLIDTEKKVCVQVTSRKDCRKLKATFDAVKSAKHLEGYKLLFFVLQEEASNLYDMTDDFLKFNGKKHVIDFRQFNNRLANIDHIKVLVIEQRLSLWLGGNYYIQDVFTPAINKAEELFKVDSPERYYPRFVSTYTSQDDKAFIYRALDPNKYKEHLLIDYIRGEVEECQGKHWLLIAAGQSGKSYEMINLVHSLNNTDNLFPVFYEAKRFKTTEDFPVPSWWHEDHMVLIIDGYDEINTEKLRSDFIGKIDEYTHSYPMLRIIITSRRNYICDDRILPKFQRLYLEKLSFNEMKRIISESGLKSPKPLIESIDALKIYPIASVPFYLNALIDYYRDNECIPNNKLELYEFLINRSYTSQDGKKAGALVKTKTIATRLLRKIALVMLYTGRKELTELELAEEMDYSTEDLENCKSFAIFHTDDEGKYRFEENAFQMYYIASYLMDGKSTKEILDVISYDPQGVSRLRPEWLDVFELLLSVMKDGDTVREELLEWTLANHREALLNVDANTLPGDFCQKVFVEILQDYKKKQISSSPELGISFDRLLASFCNSQPSFEWFLKEYEAETKLGPYMYLMSMIFWFLDSEYIQRFKLEEKFKCIVYRNLVAHGDSETVWFEAPFTALNNRIFANATDITKLINLTSQIKNLLLKKEIFRLIKEADLCDQFLDFAIANEQYIVDYTRPNDNALHYCERDDVYHVLSHVKQPENLKKVWSHYLELIKHRHHHSWNQDAKNMREVLFATSSSFVKDHPDLVECIDNAWYVEYHENYHWRIRRPEEDILKEFRQFFNSNNLTTDLSDIFKQLYNHLQGKGPYEKTERYLAKIFIRIKPGDITGISSSWNLDDEIYRLIINYLNHFPLQEINDEVSTIIKKHCLPITPQTDWQSIPEQRTQDEIELALNRRKFKAYIKGLIDKYSFNTSTELRMKIKEDDEIDVYNFLWYYLCNFRIENTDCYNIDEINKSLNRELDYYRLVVHVIERNGNFPYTQKHIKLLTESLNGILQDKQISDDCLLCMKLAVLYDIRLSDEAISRCLPLAGMEHCGKDHRCFADYALNILGLELFKKKLIELIRQPNYYTLTTMAEYAVSLHITEVYEDICSHIISAPFSRTALADTLCRNDKTDGIPLLVSHFNDFAPDVQLHIARLLLQEPKYKLWAESSIANVRQGYSLKDNIKAIRMLLSVGNVDALNETVQIVSQDPFKMCESFDAPCCVYHDTKHLSQIIKLLTITWKLDDKFNTWYSRLRETLILMATESNKQFDEVVSALRNLCSSDAQYNSLNYFIGELQCRYDPRIIKMPTVSVREAMRIIKH